MLLMSGMAWGQTDTPLLVVGDDAYQIVVDTDVSCLPNTYQSLRALQPWEQCLFSLGFTRVPGSIREWEKTTNGRRDWVRLSTNGHQGQYNGVFFGLGGANPIIPEPLACVSTAPPTLADWEHAAIGAGFVRERSDVAFYVRTDSRGRWTVEWNNEFSEYEVVVPDGANGFPTTLAALVALIYRGR